jgi:hypothetical protein
MLLWFIFSNIIYNNARNYLAEKVIFYAIDNICRHDGARTNKKNAMQRVKLEQSLLVWKIPWIIMKHQDSKLKILLHPLIAVDSHVIVNHYWFINECSNRTIFGKITTIISIDLGDNGALSELSTRKLSKAWPLRKLLEVS